MQFSRDMADTRRYYFPEKYSYALFECLTPAGFHVVGIHGLGPIRLHEFERFAYKGRIEHNDFLDEKRCVREPEDTFALLAVKGFTKLEPRHLRAALTGVEIAGASTWAWFRPGTAAPMSVSGRCSGNIAVPPSAG